MDSRERVLRAIRFQSPDRVPCAFWQWGPNDLAKLDFAVRADPVDATHTRDEYGCVWERPAGKTIGFVVGHPLSDLSALRRYRWPDPDDPARFVGLRSKAEAIRDAGQALYCEYLGMLWERLWFLLGLDTAFISIYENTDVVEEVLDGQADYMSRLLANAQEACHGLIDVWCSTEDLGMQTGAFLPRDTFEGLFGPRYARIFNAVHKNGMRAYLHSDGRMNELLPVLLGAGLDVLQVEDVRVKGVGDLAAYAGRIAFQCTLDAQSTMPRGDPEAMRREAREIVRSLATPHGGLIASIYWDPASCGVDDATQRQGVRAYQEACRGAPHDRRQSDR